VVLGTHCDPGLATHDRCHVVCCPLPVCSVAWRIPSAAGWPPLQHNDLLRQAP
jgi:hypothetical protein